MSGSEGRSGDAQPAERRALCAMTGEPLPPDGAEEDRRQRNRNAQKRYKERQKQRVGGGAAIAWGAVLGNRVTFRMVTVPARRAYVRACVRAWL